MDENQEQQRLNINAGKEIPLEKWGPYLSERQWGTVREDYSADGDAWNYFTHDQSRSKAYLWGEDGIGGISDYMQDLCFSVSLWNGKDLILKERMFGLNNHEGNHGEDVKELYYFLDNLPSHYYMKFLYKYPQAAYPYNELVEKNAALGKMDAEFEILDTTVFQDNKYFDVFIEYAKKDTDDIFIRLKIVNRSDEAAGLTVMPVLWFYNRWQYGGLKQKPSINLLNENAVEATHERAGKYYFYFPDATDRLFTDNETNSERLAGKENISAFVKDAFHDAIIDNKNPDALRNKKQGTKFSPVYKLLLPGKTSRSLVLRLTNKEIENPFEENFNDLFLERKKEADDFYKALQGNISPELANIQRQALAGLLWSRQYYHYDVERWLDAGNTSIQSNARAMGRNSAWKTLKNQDIISMPDTWEYPWYACWDTAFHAIAMASIDAVFAKNQLILLMREWYMNPEGQLPAYEWNFSDLNPPVHAFAAMEVYTIEKNKTGKGDIIFLKKIFQKLIINFTCWVNRKDANGNNIFEGGFLGLDNIGIFDRNISQDSNLLLEQADATSWMGMYALNMMDIALEIADTDISFEDAATKFYEHFVIIAEALNQMELWNEEDHFFYDILSVSGGKTIPLKVRSIVGLIPLFAVSIMKEDRLMRLKDFKKRIDWFKAYRISNNKYLPNETSSVDNTILLSLVHKERLVFLLQRFLDENEFLSGNGVRSLSKYYLSNPYTLTLEGTNYSIQYDPADSTSGMYGGNSNWRGPVWMPVNYLFIKALLKYDLFYSDSLKLEFPSASGNFLNMEEIANQLIKRLINIFLPAANGDRPLHGKYNWFYKNEDRELLQFYEYFHGDKGSGLGASHQTGWTALIAVLIQESDQRENLGV